MGGWGTLGLSGAFIGSQLSALNVLLVLVKFPGPFEKRASERGKRENEANCMR